MTDMTKCEMCGYDPAPFLSPQVEPELVLLVDGTMVCQLCYYLLEGDDYYGDD